MLLRHTHTRPVCVGWRRRKCPGMYHVCEVWMIGWHGCKGALRNLVGVLHGSVQWHGWGYVHMVFRFFVQVSCAWWRFKVRGAEFNPFSFGLLLEFRHTYDAQKLHKEGSQYNFFYLVRYTLGWALLFEFIFTQKTYTYYTCTYKFTFGTFRGLVIINIFLQLCL